MNNDLNYKNKRYLKVISTHTKKMVWLLYKETDVDEHLQNISPYELFFFQKLVLCRGLKFAFPQRISSIEVKARFEKDYWNLKPHLGKGIRVHNRFDGMYHLAFSQWYSRSELKTGAGISIASRSRSFSGFMG